MYQVCIAQGVLLAQTCFIVFYFFGLSGNKGSFAVLADLIMCFAVNCVGFCEAA